MTETNRLNVVLCWHMHQPQYKNALSGDYHLPWTYLHATKDYVDMAAHLEDCESAKAVVNFAPILLQQIDDYAQQINSYLENGTVIKDHLLAALVSGKDTTEEQRIVLIECCLKVHEDRFINRFSAYRRLADMAKVLLDNSQDLRYITEGFITDLLVWYHLAWIGETVRRTDDRIIALVEKAVDFDIQDRKTLMIVIGELLSSVIPRYKKLSDNGQVELSMTPYAHPIMPLLLDIGSAKEAMPDVALPEMDRYPGGEERVRWHMNKGIETFRQYFDIKPAGCWPSEGGVSTETIKILGEYGFKWAASGENVFRNSTSLIVDESHNEIAEEKNQPPADDNVLYHPYKVNGSETACFFRDDGLSDLIGFEYSGWHADDAVANFVNHLESISTAKQAQPGSVVSIILDGENAWEHYPENGFYFLSALYENISASPLLELKTFSQCLEAVTDKPSAVKQLSGLVAGSWVYGTFSTWIGEKDKNLGWDMLADAKRAFDRVVSLNKLSGQQLADAEVQLAICEGSDWFWWFGDYNPEDSVSDFEFLYRQHLICLYEMIGEEPPEYLNRVFTHGGGSPQTGGVMRPGSD